MAGVPCQRWSAPGQSRGCQCQWANGVLAGYRLARSRRSSAFIECCLRAASSSAAEEKRGGIGGGGGGAGALNEAGTKDKHG